jgi:hypothetical protein
MKYLSRESSITRNFLRQSSLFSLQSEVQEISSSEISEILQNFYSRHSFLSENLYNDLSSRSKKFYIRHSSSKKKSILIQSFQSRFSKFYQSSNLSEQFYKESIEYLLFVSFLLFISSRFLSHEYSSFVSSRSFVSSFSSMNQ